MSDSIEGRIGEKGQVPLLVIADDSDEQSPALLVVEEVKAEDSLPAPAVEDLTAQPLMEVAPAELEIHSPAIEPANPVPAKQPKAAKPAAVETAPAPSAPLPSPAENAEAAAPLPAVKRKRNIHPLISLAAVSLAVFASSVSVIGLLVASRTVAETRTVLERVQEHQSKMRHLDVLIDEIEGLRQREQIALVRLEQLNAGKPATGMEVRSAIASLQMSMAKYQPGGNNGMMTMLRDGQSELAERVSTTYRRVEQISEKMDKLAAGKPRTPGAR
jgi:hypothetical protein